MNNKSNLAFFLSLVIHASLFAGITYLGLEMALPEGTVTSTEVEFIAGPISQGDQLQDIEQSITTTAPTKKVKVPPPAPKPPPPPKVKPVIEPSEVAEELPASADDIPIADLEEAAELEEGTEAEPIEPETIEEPDFAADPLEQLENDLPEKAGPPTETSDDDIEQEISDVANEDGFKDAVNDENAQKFGTNAGVMSHTQLTAVPGNVPPEYPMVARFRRYEGKVELEFDVDAKGNVSNIKLNQSSGYSVLDEAAIKAHTNWRYRAGKSGRYTKPYNFNITGQAVEMPSQLRRDN